MSVHDSARGDRLILSVSGREVFMRYSTYCKRAMVLALLILPVSACDTSFTSPGGAEPFSAARVSIASAEAAVFGERLSLFGTLTAERQARLSARVDGLILRVHVDAGDQVEVGQTLLELDSATAHQALLRTRAEAAQATAAVREAERLVTEAQRLMGRQAIAATEVDSRVAALELARAAEKSAHARVREQEEIVTRHTLPAPFSGVIAEKLAEVGEWVQRGTPVLSLVATDGVRLDVRVPQERFRQIDVDAQVRVFSDALGGEPLLARIGTRVPFTDPGDRTFLLRLLIDDPQGRLQPGTSARAEISLPQVDTSAVAISRDALLRQPDGSHSVYALEDDDGRPVAHRRTVRVLHEQDDRITISGGSVKAGDRIVIRGNEALTDGQSVDVVER